MTDLYVYRPPSDVRRRANNGHYARNIEHLCAEKRLSYARDGSRSKAAAKRWKLRYPENFLMGHVRNSACRRNLACDITADDLHELLEPMRCSVTGVLLSWDNSTSGSKNPRRPSVDRIDSNVGYVKGNVQIVAWIYNALKSDLSAEEANGLILEMADGLPQ